jgi:hypothetical protein
MLMFWSLLFLREFRAHETNASARPVFRVAAKSP